KEPKIRTVGRRRPRIATLGRVSPEPCGGPNNFVQAFWGSRALATASETKATRRDFLYIATGAVGAVGVAGAAWPLIQQLNPDASVLALASIRFDVSPIPEGSSVTI